MNSVARKTGWFFYFAITLPFPVIVGALNFEDTPDLFLEIVLAASLALAIYLGAFIRSTIRNRIAWFSGIASVTALSAARVIAFDASCWQKALSFCKSIEPPYSEWLLHAMHADGHFAEDLIIFQMWLTYFLGVGLPLTVTALLLTRNKRADF